jgi:hypothetical protein
VPTRVILKRQFERSGTGCRPLRAALGWQEGAKLLSTTADSEKTYPASALCFRLNQTN